MSLCVSSARAEPFHQTLARSDSEALVPIAPPALLPRRGRGLGATRPTARRTLIRTPRRHPRLTTRRLTCPLPRPLRRTLRPFQTLGVPLKRFRVQCS